MGAGAFAPAPSRIQRWTSLSVTRSWTNGGAR